jgi:hypothetical protein
VIAVALLLAAADGVSNQPYIDQLREGLEDRGVAPAPRDSYIDSVKKKLEPAPDRTYIDELKESDPSVYEKKPEESHIEGIRRGLEPRKEESTIEAVKAGRSSQLRARKEGGINHAAGLQFGVSATREIVAAAGAGLASFDSLYGDKYAPELRAFYEFQPFHSEWFGNVGVVLTAGAAAFRGSGNFQFNLTNNRTGQPFGTESQTTFRFVYVPVSAGLNYRFNLFRILRPYVQGAPTLIGYSELRSDEKSGNQGISRGIQFGGGVNLLLDWMMPGASWDLYADFGVKHYYLTFDFTRLATFGGDVDFTASGFSAGLTYEF